MADIPEPNPLKLLGRVARGFTRIVDGGLRELGLAAGQLPVLVSLKKSKALSQAELARIAQVEQPSMAQLLARMERDGLVERVDDPQDKRSRLISLTPLAAERRAAFAERSIDVVSVPNANGKVDLAALLSDLAAREVNEVHVEAGHKLNGSLLREGLVMETIGDYRMGDASTLIEDRATGLMLTTLALTDAGFRAIDRDTPSTATAPNTAPPAASAETVAQEAAAVAD
eukprot:gene30725-40857_t